MTAQSPPSPWRNCSSLKTPPKVGIEPTASQATLDHKAEPFTKTRLFYKIHVVKVVKK